MPIIKEIFHEAMKELSDNGTIIKHLKERNLGTPFWNVLCDKYDYIEEEKNDKSIL